jgi:hypothetical protein
MHLNLTKGCIRVISEQGDWVLLHMRKIFSSDRKSKLQPREDSYSKFLNKSTTMHIK